MPHSPAFLERLAAAERLPRERPGPGEPSPAWKSAESTRATNANVRCPMILRLEAVTVFVCVTGPADQFKKKRKKLICRFFSLLCSGRFKKNTPFWESALCDVTEGTEDGVRLRTLNLRNKLEINKIDRKKRKTGRVNDNLAPLSLQGAPWCPSAE